MHTLRRHATTLAAVVLAAASTVFPAVAAPDLDAAADRIVERINAERRGQGREPLDTEPRLAAAALVLAGHMARTGRYGHQADGRTPAERVAAQGYEHCLVSENIAWQRDSRGFSTAGLATGFVDGWLRSPPHRRNLLDANARQTGVAIARAADGRYYAVQVFARPQSQAVAFSVANRTPRTLAYTLDGRRVQLPPRTTHLHRRCDDAPLRLHLPGGDTTLHPADGARYTVPGMRVATGD